MPRKPRKHRQMGVQPITFSQFSRSLAGFATASNSKVTNTRSKSKSSSKMLDAFSDNSAIKNSLRKSNLQSESSDDDSSQEVVQADFAFFDPKPDDFHGVKILLQTYLDDMEWDLSGFVDLILAQTTVGTVVKIEDDEDNSIFALLTTLNLGRYKDHKCITELKGYFLNICKESTSAGELKVLLEDQAEHVGLLVSQRVMNLPPQLLPHLYKALFDEISWATEDEPTEDLRKSFQFKYYLVLTKFYKKKNAPNKKGGTSGKEEDVIYLKPEEELLHELSLWSFTFPLRTQPIVAPELKNYHQRGLVMAIKADKISTFQDQLQSLIDDS